MKGVGDKEILETYLYSASKSTSDKDIFPHGTKSFLTSVICAWIIQSAYYLRTNIENNMI
jgi:hypothetical protein